MRSLLIYLITTFIGIGSLAQESSLSISMKLDIGEAVSDVSTSEDGTKWLITTLGRLIVWDTESKTMKWSIERKAGDGYPLQAAMNNSFAYLLSNSGHNLIQIDVNNGDILNEIELKGKTGHYYRTQVSAINRVPGTDHSFLLTGNTNDLQSGTFNLDDDKFVLKQVSGKGQGMLRFSPNGKFLVETLYDNVLYGFTRARDFDQVQTLLRPRWKPVKGTTYGYIPSEDGRNLYQAYFYRSVNYKKEYLIQNTYTITKKVISSLQVDDQPFLFSLAGEGDKLLFTTVNNSNDFDLQQWYLLDIATWTLQDITIPFSNPGAIIYDAASAYTFIPDLKGAVWVLSPSETSNPIATYQLDGTKSEVSFAEIDEKMEAGKDEDAIAKINSDAKSASEDPNYYSEMAFKLSNEGRFGAAYTAFKRLYDAYPNDQFANTFMAWFSILNGSLEEVEPLLQKAVELKPFDPFVHQIYGYYHLLSGNRSKAEEEIKKVISYAVKNDGLSEKNTDFGLLNRAGYEQDFSSFDQWSQSIVIPDLERRERIFKSFQAAQQLQSPRERYAQMMEVIRQEKSLKVPRVPVLGAAMSEAVASGRKTGKVKEAMKLGSESVELLTPFGDMALLIGANTNAGHAYNQGFEFDKAEQYYEESLRLMDLYQGQFEMFRGGVLNGLGGVYDNQGEQNRALIYYEKALEAAKALGNAEDKAIALGNIATVYISQGKDVGRAIQMLEQGNNIYVSSGDKVALANNFNNIGYGLMLLNKPMEAIEEFRKAESLYAQLGMASGLALVNNTIGKLLISYDRKIEAISAYRKALKYVNEIEDPEVAKSIYANLAGALLGQERYAEAANYAEKAIHINEKLLTKASPQSARGIRSRTNNYYRILSLAEHRSGNYIQAFEAHERNRSRELLRKIGASELVSTSQLQHILSDDQVAIDFNVVHMHWEIHSHLFPIVISNKKVVGKEYADSTLINSLLQEGEEQFVVFMGQRSALQKIREYISEKGIPQNVAQSLVRDANLEKAIEFYRHLIKEPNARNEVLRKSYARVLYDLLITPIKKEISGKKELIIMPDGPLAFLPFETLMDEQGTYLAELYKIRYVQSAAVLTALQQRKYSDQRKPLLAFGGPVFEELDPNEGGIDTNTRGIDFNQLQQSYYKAEERGGSMRPTYIQMGFTKMTPLPGTIYETNQIKNIVVGSELYQNDAANENKLKSMASANQLANYKVLHFATHGWAYSEIPELSTIVLGQYRTQRGKEDGFLRVPEIEKLNIKADFVNLSACETALGRLYSSEGVVGLTQAFLVAGANSISVTQWTVSDEGTAVFMTEMYRKVFQQRQSYLNAFAATKIEFIKGKYGEQFQHPNYWGPFVYYGH